jgi:hypothetical protein
MYSVPPMQTMYTEGLPGIGKTFVINTLMLSFKILKGFFAFKIHGFSGVATLSKYQLGI